MNNENKSHEEIYNKVAEESDASVSYKQVALKAMAEVAALRDKEVEELSEHNEAWHNEHLRVCNELDALKNNRLLHRINKILKQKS